MFTLVVRVQIKPGHRDEFLKAMFADAHGSVANEPGCLEFNIVQDHKDPDTLYLFEVYKDEAAVEAHRNSPHFKAWVETTKDWLAAPPEINTGDRLFPEK